MNSILEKFLRRRVLWTLLSLYSFSINAQSDITLRGRLLNENTEGLIGATVLLSAAADSSMIAYAVSDKEGRFKLTTDKNGTCILEISYLGLGSFAKTIELREDNKFIDLGSITLLANNQLLDEFGLKADFIPIVIKKDTIEYNAAAFRSENDDAVEDLLKKLPGIEVERDGTIKAQGEEVENILVDGKPFFEGDTKVASKNIPADIVDKIQVFDKASDLAHFTGVPDNNKEKTINLELQDGKNKGTFGKIDAAVGYKNRYQSSANINRFDERNQISLIGNANNTNEQTFSLKDYLDFTGGIDDLLNGGDFDFSQLPSSLLDNSGLNEMSSVGLNFNRDFSDDLELRTNYFFSAVQNSTESSKKMRSPAAIGFFDNILLNEENSHSNKHKLNTKLKYNRDSTSLIQLHSKFQFGQNNKALHSTGQAQLESITLNNTEQYFENQMRNYSVDIDLQYLKNLRPGRRFYSIETDFNQSQYNIDALLNNIVTNTDTSHNSPIDPLNQQQYTWSNQTQWKGAFHFTESIGKGQFLSGHAESSIRFGQRRKIFLDSIGAEQYLRNEDLSNAIDLRLQKQLLKINYTLQRKDYQLRLGLGPQWSQIIASDQETSINFLNNLGDLGFNYSFSKSKKLNLDINSFVRLPSVEQLQAVEDNSDPLNIVIGNPDLEPERIHQFALNYNSFNNFYMRSVFLGFNGSLTNKRIIYERTIDDQLRSVNKTINGKEEWQLSTFADYSSPLGFGNIRLKLKGDQGFQKSYLSVNNSLSPYVFWNSNTSFTIDNIRKQKADLSFGYSYGIKSSIIGDGESAPLKLTRHEISGDMSIFLPKKWTIYGSADWQYYPQSPLGEQEDFCILDLGIKKSISNNKFSFFLSAHNLLNEQYILQQNAMGFQNIQQQKNRLGRYFLLGMQYKIRSFGK